MFRSKRKVSHSFFAYFCIVLTASMGTIFGFNVGAILSSKVRLINIFMLEIYDVDSMVCTFLLGAMAGLFVGGRVCSVSGRVMPILGSFAMGVIGQCSSTLSPTFSTLFISEFAVGISFGLYFVSAICYSIEISPMKSRGRAGSLIGVFLTLGVLISALLKEVLPYNSIASVATLIAICVPVLVLGFLRLPESPRYLALSANSDEALSVLIRLRPSASDAARELAAINECVLGEDRGISFFIHSIVFRRQLWFLLFISLLAAMSGIILGPYMAMDMVKSFYISVGQLHPNARFDILSGLLFATLIAAFAGAYVCFVLCDSAGRRKLLLFSIILNQLMLFSIYLCQLLPVIPVVASTLVTLFMAVFVFSSLISGTLLLTVLFGELLPLKGREFGVTVLGIINVILLMMGLYFYDRAGRLFGPTFIYAFFMFSSVIFFAVVYKVMPETRYHLLESMENTIYNNRSLLALKK